MRMTKRIALAAGLPAALIALSACSTYDSYGYGYGGYVGAGYSDYGYDDGYYGYDRPYYGGGSYYSGASLAYYDLWYDNFYGPVYGGYWGPDNYFYYQIVVGGPYVRDHHSHFRRDRFDGAKF